MPSHNRASGARASAPWLWLLGLAITAALLWWTFRDVSLAEVSEHLRRTRLVPLLGTVTAATATFWIRAIRWQAMLGADDSRPPFGPLWHATAIGFMANNLLPARAGEVARAFVGSRLAAFRFSTTLSSLVLERALDGVAILALMAIPLATLSETRVNGRDVVPLLQLLAVIFGTVIVAAFGLALAPGLARRLARRAAAAVLPSSWAARAVALVEGTLDGFAVLRRPHRAALVVAWTGVLWLVNAASFLLAFAAFGVAAPPEAAFLVQGLIGIGVAVPSAPGFFGPFEFATRAALVLYGVDSTHAVSYAVGYHLLTFVPITTLGLWSLRHAAHLRLGQLAQVRADLPQE